MATRLAHVVLSIAVVVGSVTVAGMLPPVQARAKALPMLAEAVGLDVPRPLAPGLRRDEVELDGVTGHLYVPREDSPPVLLVPGAAPQGKDDPRLVRLARAVSRAGRTVFVPDLVLAERRLEREDLDGIVRAAVALSERPGAEGRTSMLGISYGGSLALVAAADPRLSGRLAIVATFGAYFDLTGVIQAVSTGTSLVDGGSVPWQGHPLAAEILRQQALMFAPAGTRDDLRAALSGQADPSELSPGARSVFDLVTNTDPRRTFELAARLPEPARDVLTGFSPSSVAASIEAPVAAMHSTDDPAVPFGELRRLEAGLPGARTITVEAFRHVDLRAAGPGAWIGVAGDVWGAWRFASWVLEAQE